MWSNEHNSIREADDGAWTNVNPWSNARQGVSPRTTVPLQQPSMNQGYSTGATMRQPSRSWDLHTQQQFQPGMPSRWGSNSNWAINGTSTPPTASLNSPVKASAEIWGPTQQQQAQWQAAMMNGEQKRTPAPLHRSMTGPSQGWAHKVDQQTPWDMGSQQDVMANPDWNSAQKWNGNPYSWHQSEGSPEWGSGAQISQNDMGWHQAGEELSPPGSWPIPKAEVHPEVGSNGVDMLWQDPNPKARLRKIAKDTGTAIWGDPESQKRVAEIRHWKNPETNNYNNTTGADWTTADQLPQNGWGEPMQHKMWDLASAWIDPHDDSIPDMVIPQLAHALGTTTLFDTLQGVAVSNPQFANQLSEHFQGAINRNWINQAIYSAPLSSKFATLHQLIKKLYKREAELLQLRQHPPSPSAISCKERIFSESQHIKSELAEMQRAIFGVPLPTTTINGTHDGQSSRLQQWKKNGNAMANGRGMVAGSLPSDSVKGSYGSDAMMNSLINAAHNLSINADSLSNSWKTASLEWSPPATRDDRRKSSEESRVSVTSQLNTDVQEFIPGKKWEYRNPNKIAEDPNATPGSCKPDPRLTSAALRLQMDGQVKEATPAAVQSPVLVNTSQNGWNLRVNSKPGDSPLISPNNEEAFIKEFFLPNCWALFQLNNGINECQFQQSCQSAGNMVNFCMIGSKIACVKFNNSNVYQILQRLKSDFNVGLEQFRVVPDEEFNNKMLKHTRCVIPNGFESAPPPSIIGHQASSPWNFVQPMYHNDPPCQY